MGSILRVRLVVSAVLLAGSALEAASPGFVRKPFLQKGASTHVSVCWRADTAASLTVRYGTDSTALDKVSAAGPHAADACVRIDSLEPATKYFYEVFAGSAGLQGGNRQFFLTHPPVGTPGNYAFWAIGDFGTGLHTRFGPAQARVRDAFVRVNGGSHVAGVLMLGDNAYGEGTDEQFTHNLFHMYPDILARSFSWPAIGNHENLTAGARGYLDAFSLPSAGESWGVPSNTELYYSFDYGNIHFIVLDSEISSREKAGAQYQWLQQDLQATQQDWIVAYWHHPPYTWGYYDSDFAQNHIDMRQNFVPLLEQYGVDLVLSGHSHNYERSYLMDGAYGGSASNIANAAHIFLDASPGNPEVSGPYLKAKGGNQGTVYAVVGSSGTVVEGKAGPDHPRPLHPVMHVRHPIHGSLILTVEDSVATGRFIDSAGAIRDQFQVVKNRSASSSGIGRPFRADRFSRSGRRFEFSRSNTLTFRLYTADGRVVFQGVPRGNWEVSREFLPTGEYYFRFGQTFGRIPLP